MRVLSNLFLLIFFCISCNTIKITSDTDYSGLIANPKSILTKEQLLKDKEALRNYHPNPFNSFPEKEWDSLINIIAKDLPSIPIRETEKTLIRRKLLDRVTYEDPHLRFLPVLKPKKGVKLKDKQIKAIPCSFLLINDTLLVDESHNEFLEKGDKILSIDGVGIQDYLNAAYKDRFIYSFALQAYFHNSFKSIYHIELERHNKKLELNIDGISISKLIYGTKTCESSFYDDSQIGYFTINNFDYNKYLVKKFEAFLNKVKKRKYKNVIIDLRKNHGGSGDRFDELISMFTKKAKIPYQSGVKLKVSKATYKDYSYLEKDLGKLVNLPDSLFVQECSLDSSLYKGDINYYVLISKNTASTAATFANIFQYNNIGLLVGEPLAHNALNYGEIITAERDNSFWTISTVEMFEYTKAENGILKPDISIPFVAKEYMEGGDPVLEKCLEYIKVSKVIID